MRIVHVNTGTNSHRNAYANPNRDFYVGTYGDLYSTSYSDQNALTFRYIYAGAAYGDKHLRSTDSYTR